MKKTELKVFQSNAYTQSKQTFNLNEKRVMQFIIAKIQPTDTEFKRYEIPIVEIADMAKISTKNMYPFAKNLMYEMVTKFIMLEDKENDHIRAFNYFTELEYQSGVITVELNRNIHQLFLNIKKNKTHFTAYELTEFMTLSSVHAQRIYELLKQYSKSRQRSREIDLLELKKMMNIENKYKLYSDFRKVVLEYAHKHIEEHTNLRFKWKGITKRGRKVVAIKFYNIHEQDEDLDKLREVAYLDNCIGEQIYNEEFGTYLTIKKIVKNKDKTYSVHSKDDDIWYDYPNKEKLQECIAKAQIQKGLI